MGIMKDLAFLLYKIIKLYKKKLRWSKVNQNLKKKFNKLKQFKIIIKRKEKNKKKSNKSK